jgi:hypothetical protein
MHAPATESRGPHADLLPIGPTRACANNYFGHPCLVRARLPAGSMHRPTQRTAIGARPCHPARQGCSWPPACAPQAAEQVLFQGCSASRPGRRVGALKCLPKVTQCSPLRWRTSELHVPPLTSALTSSTMTCLHSSNRQSDIALKAHVASICLKCFRCFIWMLHVFHLNIAKVGQDIAYVAINIHLYCKCMSKYFNCFFRTILQMCVPDVLAVSSRCCMCFIWMLHML